jgi:hypothetical protein
MIHANGLCDVSEKSNQHIACKYGSEIYANNGFDGK